MVDPELRAAIESRFINKLADALEAGATPQAVLAGLFDVPGLSKHRALVYLAAADRLRTMRRSEATRSATATPAERLIREAEAIAREAWGDASAGEDGP